MHWNAERQRLRSSPTDLSNFLGCRHRTGLDLRGARGEVAIPRWVDPLADTLRARGLDHERRYLDTLRLQDLVIEDLTGVPPEEGEARLSTAMRHGADVIVQAPLRGDGWFGYADVLRRVAGESALGAWHYEAHDTKLARETKGGTILQLCVYTELLALHQERMPDQFTVVTPAAAERYRVADYAAFYRFVKDRFLAFIATTAAGTYPNPVSHCDVCRWDDACRARRRADDHLTFVAGLGHTHQTELEGRAIVTLAQLAGIPVPIEFRPRRGARETYERLREQARLQQAQRTTHRPTYELLPVVVRVLDPAKPESAQREGLQRLPEPSSGDLFLDLEGDPFAREGGREYLFGLLHGGEAGDSGRSSYWCAWATDDEQERAVFEQVVDRIMEALARDPAMHVYHYAPYEPAAFKRLSGRYASRESDVDLLLRGGRFIDLYGVVRQALRAGIESYSIKQLEPFYGFVREIELRRAGDRRRVVEVALETQDASAITGEVRAAVEAYNRDDCRSTWALRGWLEQLRATEVASGVDCPRPPLVPGEPGEQVRERDRVAVELRSRLLARTPATDNEGRALHLLAYMVDWHRREERVTWGEYHRLREQADDDLLDEPEALAGLTFVERVFTPQKKSQCAIDRYRYPFQENGLAAKDTLKLKDDSPIGEVDAIDKQALTVDIRKPRERPDVHPEVVIVQNIIGTGAQEGSIQRIAHAVADGGIDGPDADRLVQALLQATSPRLTQGTFGDAPTSGDETASDRAVRLVRRLDASVLAIQGPPGAGKTYTGARMIAALVADGCKVGVVATGHKVIRKLIVDAALEARQQGITIAAAHKPGEDALPSVDGVAIEQVKGNDGARAWLAEPGGRVLGGTAWLWARPEFAKAVDVLFADEAGQISLANVLAVTPAAHSLVLLGDPQQLEQPKKGSHPDGVDVSALEHMLGAHQTMPDDRGIFLPVTWRLAPEICAFTSEVFYEGKLRSHVDAGTRRLVATSATAASPLEGAGLRVIEVLHEGCRNASDEEVAVVSDLVGQLLGSGLAYRDQERPDQRLALDDILVVAPYNAQVARLRDALAARFGKGARVGTVDKFQGQEAPVVIYSMTSSRPEDAPRGMEFLYSLNRLNVATSRAQALCIVVASPHLFEPECRTPRQMQLASALCRYREMSTGVR